ncbi:MAG: hypothetical protein HYV38_02240 [Candidatus Levybacteria bacterium]|nr:hypothetical protein [Candidatus Levybacteria bacterium]
MNIKKIAFAGAAAGLFLSSAAGVFAAGPGYSPPPAVSNVCNAGHGAFAAFSDPSLHGTPGQPPYFGDNELGSARGGATGENNSNYSESCRNS